MSKFDLHKEILKVVPIWVKLPNLPLNYWSDNSLSRIWSVLGVPVYANECTTKVLRESYARILVEMDVTKDITHEIQVEDSSGRKFSQKVAYDWLPSFCKRCLMIGHNCEVKRKIQGKPAQKRVPKVAGPTVRGGSRSETILLDPVSNDAKQVQVSFNKISEHGVPIKEVDISFAGDPPLVVEPLLDSTPVNTPTQVDALLEEHWKVVTRKSKRKQVAFQCARMVNYNVGNDSRRVLGDQIPIYHVRGLNDLIKIKKVKDFLMKQKAECCAMFKTRVRRHKVKTIQKKFGNQWCWISNYDYSPIGRIWFGWKPEEVKVIWLETTEQCMTLQVLLRNNVFIVVSVYGLHIIGDRKKLWKKLLQIRNTRACPLIILGDFNAVHSVADRINGVEVSEVETQDFTQFT